MKGRPGNRRRRRRRLHIRRIDHYFNVEFPNKMLDFGVDLKASCFGVMFGPEAEADVRATPSFRYGKPEPFEL
jgi:hypothetical protein